MSSKSSTFITMSYDVFQQCRNRNISRAHCLCEQNVSNTENIENVTFYAFWRVHFIGKIFSFAVVIAVCLIKPHITVKYLIKQSDDSVATKRSAPRSTRPNRFVPPRQIICLSVVQDAIVARTQANCGWAAAVVVVFVRLCPQPPRNSYTHICQRPRKPPSHTSISTQPIKQYAR